MEYQPKYKRYVLAISFANYLEGKSGMPKVMMEHAKMFEKKTVSYVSIFTVKKTICHDRYMLFCMYGLTVDGKYYGIYQLGQIMNLLNRWDERGFHAMDIHVHHLLYNRIGNIDKLLSSFPQTPIKFFLHDYYIMCRNYTLLKNGEVFCGGKGIGIEACNDCASKEINERVNPEIRELLRQNIQKITFISPSERMKKIFCDFYPEYENKAVVIPHQKYSKLYRGNIEPLSLKEKIKVGYLGMPMKHKGWETWCRIVEKADPKSYDFYVFNRSDDVYAGAKKVAVHYSQDNLNAMTDAIRSNKIDAVVMWATWPETYSYTCFEAFAANAFILTYKDSGNIADVVNKNKNGLVLDSEEEIMQLFSSPEKFRSLLNEYKSSTPGGPDDLTENDEIVNISLEGAENIARMKKTTIRKPVNHLLLWVLNKLYGNGESR